MFHKIINPLVAIVLPALASGCVNPYERNYQALPNSSNTPPEQFTGEPRLEAASTDNTRSEVARMYQNGYGIIGISAFVSASRSPSEALAQVKKVGAAVAVANEEVCRVTGIDPLIRG